MLTGKKASSPSRRLFFARPGSRQSDDLSRGRPAAPSKMDRFCPFLPVIEKVRSPVKVASFSILVSENCFAKSRESKKPPTISPTPAFPARAEPDPETVRIASVYAGEKMVRPERFELPTFWFVASGRIPHLVGLESFTNSQGALIVPQLSPNRPARAPGETQAFSRQVSARGWTLTGYI